MSQAEPGVSCGHAQLAATSCSSSSGHKPEADSELHAPVGR